MAFSEIRAKDKELSKIALGIEQIVPEAMKGAPAPKTGQVMSNRAPKSGKIFGSLPFTFESKDANDACLA